MARVLCFWDPMEGRGWSWGEDDATTQASKGGEGIGEKGEEARKQGNVEASEW